MSLNTLDDDLRAATRLLDVAQRALIEAKISINGLRPLQGGGKLLPTWVGDDPVVETMTYGQGDFGQRCRLCGQDDYGTPITHISGCPAEGMDDDLLRERTDLDLEKGV